MGWIPTQLQLLSAVVLNEKIGHISSSLEAEPLPIAAVSSLTLIAYFRRLDIKLAKYGCMGRRRQVTEVSPKSQND